MHGHVLRVYDATIGGAISHSHDGANLAPDVRPNVAPYICADIGPYISAVHVCTYTRTDPSTNRSSDHEPSECCTIRL